MITTDVRETGLVRRKETQEIIETDTFVPTGRTLGAGCWGVVDEYKDPVGQMWALKRFRPNETAARQMQERGWTEEDVMRNEAVHIAAAQHHVVPRIIERDKGGRLYVGMPVYHEGNLEDRKTALRRDFAEDGDIKKILGVASDIADALSYLHYTYAPQQGKPFSSSRRVHGDVKPSNIFIEGGRAYLGDLGSSTCISIGGSGSLRGEHGDVNYRAPECFAEDAKPSTKADVWSLGSILYELVSGERIYSGFDFSSGSQKDLEALVKSKIKTAPRKLRKFLRGCLAVNPDNRCSDGGEALIGLEKTLENLNGWKSFKRYLKWSLPAVASVALLALAAYKSSTYEPQKLEMPSTKVCRDALSS